MWFNFKLKLEDFIIQGELVISLTPIYNISSSYSFSCSYSSCLLGSIKAWVSYSKFLTNSLDSPIPNLWQIQTINLSTVS